MLTNGRKPRRIQLDDFDAAILEFAEQWTPYGGGHEFVFAEFGIDLAEFYRRLQRVLYQLEPHECHPNVVSFVRHNYALHHGRP